MNLYFGPPPSQEARRGIKRLGPYGINDQISDDVGMLLTQDEVHIVGVLCEDNYLVVLGKDDAIAAAKDILLHFEEPFCNRVKQAA